MWDWLNNWVSNPTIVLAAIAVAGLFWRIGRWTQHVDAGLQTLGNRIDTLRDEIDTFRDEVRQHLVETRRTLDTLLLRVGGSEAIAAGKSPLRLTDRGKRIAASLNMDEWIASTAEELRARTEGLEPFEIDALCNEYVRKNLDAEWHRGVARAIYEFSTDERAVGDILRILLRDALLKSPGTAPNGSEAG